MTTIRIWRNLKSLKRAGRRHDPNGVAATAPGEMAVVCPACPHPGKNLPDDWRSAPKEDRYVLICSFFQALMYTSFHFSFLYTLFMACDANFRLKLKNRKLRDLDLAPGWGYYVPEKEYYADLKDRIGDTEVSYSSSSAVLCLTYIKLYSR